MQPETDEEGGDLLRIEVQMCSVHLVESPEEVLGCTVDVVAVGIVGEVIVQWRSRELLSE